MYSQYWNLERQPFECEADPALFFRSRTHQGAILKLRYLLDSNKGIGLLCGGSGSGKTFLLRLLVRELDEQFDPVVHLHFPFLNAEELVGWLAAELGADESALQSPDAGMDFKLRQFQSRLQFFAEQNRHPVIVIDEAHLVEDHRVLQTIQLLLNYREDTPFSLILSGHPTLLSRLERVPELSDRIGTRSLLQPFERDETIQYVTHRLAVCGQSEKVFDDDALHEIHELSGGVPRRINRIADLALLMGYADGLNTVAATQIGAVSVEMGLA